MPTTCHARNLSEYIDRSERSLAQWNQLECQLIKWHDKSASTYCDREACAQSSGRARRSTTNIINTLLISLLLSLQHST
ncbi:uncharacterized protein YALI1_D04270g [Yarrowia lipolytica]|uniref:Uncharacterized protein n=1 Tax=Yarrowia lipolytica TaxID=4952 RepID=A0A1D8ND11_YARLL|nr:hypothetical protein YALI1_D04270g [Yarrowia lipolytica]